jgi:hypothetical protein
MVGGEQAGGTSLVLCFEQIDFYFYEGFLKNKSQVALTILSLQVHSHLQINPDIIVAEKEKTLLEPLIHAYNPNHLGG